MASYLTKGKLVYVEGRLQTRSYDDKDGKKQYFTEVVVNSNDIVLLSGSGDNPGGGSRDDEFSERPVSMPRSAQRPKPAPDAGFDQGITDDDVPF